MAFCTKCGASVPDDVNVCADCGEAVKRVVSDVPVVNNEESVPAPAPAVNPQPQVVVPQQPQAVVQPQIVAQQQQFTSSAASQPFYGAPAPDSPYAVMGVLSFMKWAILFSLPMVGWIICLVTAFAGKNFNERNYARAQMIFMLIGIVFSFAIVFFCIWLIGLSGVSSFEDFLDEIAWSLRYY